MRDTSLLGVCMSMYRKREVQPEDVRQQDAVTKRRRRTALDSDPSKASLKAASDTFTSAVKQGPDYVCTCCHRLMYHQSVQGFHRDKYTKLPKPMSDKVFDPKYLRRSVNQEVWICKTCHRTLKRGKMLAQAKGNNLGLADIPPELSDMNKLETRLISLRIPFMKIVSLATGQQKKISGPAVNVSSQCAISFHACLHKRNW